MTPEIEMVVVPPDQWASRAADVLEVAIRSSIGERGQCVVGISGGSTPNEVFVLLSTRDLEWDQVTLVQVDERIAAIGSDARNLTGQLEAFTDLPVRWLPLPVAAPISEGIADFIDGLHLAAGSPPAIDVPSRTRFRRPHGIARTG
ncbi:MAG: 6-phosphogluconolactonase [Acidimicrobiales bacterium]